MTSNTEQARIEAVLAAVDQGHRDKDPAAIGAQFASDAVIFDLAPPLGHGLDVPGLAAWLDTWDGPIDQEWRNLTVKADGDLAFCHGLCKVSATTKSEGQRAEWWQRVTVCLSRAEGSWKIVHEHSSVPFYMDGSDRAATDLQP
ncbi:MAG: YybH family protein [Alphaproteobacteria bacterium]